MIIFAQDKKNLVDCVRVSIEKNIGGKKNEKYLLIGWNSMASSLPPPTLGAYADEKTAMDELEKIYAAFESGAKTYSIK